jgi:anti-sigma regulatory factor (Ser/Thr protein kinase)
MSHSVASDSPLRTLDPAGSVAAPIAPPHAAVDVAAGHTASGGPCFRHESLFYFGEAEYLAGTLPLIEQALELGLSVLIVVAPARLALLRATLGASAERVGFADVHELGRNPGRMIPAWQQFLEEHPCGGEPALGISEPVWAGRSAAELSECQRHESLLNLAFAGGRPWRLLCPYDLDGVPADALEAAWHTHPFIGAGGASQINARYRQPGWHDSAFSGALPEPAGAVRELCFDREQLPTARRLVAGAAADAMVATRRSQQLVLAVSELTANSVRHGGGTGTLRVWQDGATLLCEVRDAGRIEAPLAGRVRPLPDQLTGRGLWLVNQLCDLAQIRSDRTGTVVRLHMDVLRGD